MKYAIYTRDPKGQQGTKGFVFSSYVEANTDAEARSIAADKLQWPAKYIRAQWACECGATRRNHVCPQGVGR